MNTLCAILKGAKQARDLFRQLETASIASVLADIEFQAAKDAILNIPHVVDEKCQVWLCIGHLGSSLAGYQQHLRSAGMMDAFSIAAGSKMTEVRAKARFVLCLRAICHAYLNEMVRCRKDLDDAKFYKEPEPRALEALWGLSALFGNPIAVGQILLGAVGGNLEAQNRARKACEIDDDALSNLESCLFGSPA